MKKKIIIVGSGWGTKGFLDTISSSDYDIHVVSINKEFEYQLFFSEGIINNKIKTSFDLTNKYSNINFIKNKVDDVDFKNNKIITNTNNEIDYDYIIFSHGSIINDFNIEGVKKYTYSLKNKNDMIILNNALQKLKKDSHIAVIGCGLTGTEIIGHLIDCNKYNIHAIDGLTLPLNQFSQSMRLYLKDFWSTKYIHMYFDEFVKKINKDEIITHTNNKIKYDLAIWCGGIKIHPLSEIINNKISEINRFGIPVNKKLMIPTTNNAFACGDCAFTGNPPTAQVAYQQGCYLGQQFNNKWKNQKEFTFNNRGQVCYIGDRKGIYQNDDIIYKDKIGYSLMKTFKFLIRYF